MPYENAAAAGAARAVAAAVVVVVVVVAAAAAFVLMAMWEVSWKFQAGREERVKVSKYIRIEPHLTSKWVETNSYRQYLGHYPQFQYVQGPSLNYVKMLTSVLIWSKKR